jgi:hypothetical protein
MMGFIGGAAYGMSAAFILIYAEFTSLPDELWNVEDASRRRGFQLSPALHRAYRSAAIPLCIVADGS